MGVVDPAGHGVGQRPPVVLLGVQRRGGQRVEGGDGVVDGRHCHLHVRGQRQRVLGDALPVGAAVQGRPRGGRGRGVQTDQRRGGQCIRRGGHQGRRGTTRGGQVGVSPANGLRLFGQLVGAGPSLLRPTGVEARSGATQRAGDRTVVIDIADGLAQQRRDAVGPSRVGGRGLGVCRLGVSQRARRGGGIDGMGAVDGRQRAEARQVRRGLGAVLGDRVGGGLQVPGASVDGREDLIRSWVG